MRKYFGTDGIRGRANGVITPELALKVGQAAGLAVPARRLPPPGGDRQGHAPLRLHDRDRARRRLHLGRHGRAAARPDADAGRRHADALDARRSRRDDLRLAQPVRGQRHQAVRPGRLQALRRGRARDRGADRRAISADASPRSAQLGRAKRIDSVAGALHRVRQAHLAARSSTSTACASSSTAPTAPPTRSRPRRSGSSAPRSSPSASSPTASTSTTRSARPRPEALIRKVRELRADIGIALDGDADRVLIVDEKGQIVDGDQLMARRRALMAARTAACRSPASSRP